MSPTNGENESGDFRRAKGIASVTLHHRSGRKDAFQAG
jgi:hypothetical protein